MATENTPPIQIAKEHPNTISHKVYDGLEVKLESARFWPRFCAYLTDLSIVALLSYLFILAVIILLFVVIVPMAAAGLLEDMTPAIEKVVEITVIALVILLLVGMLAIYHGYFIYYENKYGTTPGKRIFGLRVTTTDGGRLSVGQCIIRDLARYVDCMLVIPGVLSVSISGKRQRLGDLVAGTLVVFSKAQVASSDFLYLPRADYLATRAMVTIQGLNREVAKSYLQFAFHRYISRSAEADQHTENLWLDKLNPQLHYLDKSVKLSDQDKLLFFAEHCLQLLNSPKQSAAQTEESVA